MLFRGKALIRDQEASGTDALPLFGVMTHPQGGCLVVAPVLSNAILDQLPVVPVQVGGGFVQQQDLRSLGQLTGQGKALSLTARESRHRPIQTLRIETHVRQQLLVLAGKMHTDPFRPPVALRGQIGHAPAPLRAAEGQVLESLHVSLSLVRLQICDGPQEQRLAGAGGPGQGHAFSGSHLQVDGLQVPAPETGKNQSGH